MNSKPKRPHSTKPNAARDWIDCLRTPGPMDGILARTEDLAKLKVSLHKSLKNLELAHIGTKIEPVWSSQCAGELLLMVPNASISARLQQSLPSIINELSNNGVVCSAIKVKLKPALPNAEWAIKPQAQPKERPKGLNTAARAAWNDLLEKLDPHSDLRKAVERLLQAKVK